MNNFYDQNYQKQVKKYIQQYPWKCVLRGGIIIFVLSSMLGCAGIWGCPNSCNGKYNLNHRMVNGVCKPC
jgi:hypothetical protein